ncbi:MAG: hypothetical protein P8179_24945 [Candidatus Thiodiazotropha sp.]|jgi:hypothetical protein
MPRIVERIDPEKYAIVLIPEAISMDRNIKGISDTRTDDIKKIMSKFLCEISFSISID